MSFDKVTEFVLKEIEVKRNKKNFMAFLIDYLLGYLQYTKDFPL